MRLFLWPAGIAALSVVMALTLAATIYPVELDVREGTSWLQVLAQSAGLNLYDHSKTAFINMNHGPFDPLVKYWVHSAFPFLGSSAVTRFFVPILPLLLVLQARLLLCLSWGGSALFGAVLWAILYKISDYVILGRSDPLALCLLTATQIACHFAPLSKRVRSPEARPISALRSTLPAGVAGLFGMCTILTNWRFAPAVAVAALMPMDSLVAGLWRGSLSLGRAALKLVFFLIGFLAPSIWIFGHYFHWNHRLYYRHFFGFFTPESGWGNVQAPTFEWIPMALIHQLRWPLVLGLALAGYWFLLATRETRSETRSETRAEFHRGWRVLVMALGWMPLAYGYFLNHGGGGLYYFDPWIVLLPSVIATATLRPARFFAPRRPLRFALTVVPCAVLLMLHLPWRIMVRDAQGLWQARKTAVDFLSSLPRQAPIFSDDLHLFRDEYRGEVIDMGDTVETVMRTDYFGADFQHTAQQAFAELELHPPLYVLVAEMHAGKPAKFTNSDAVKRLLISKSYTPILTNPDLLLLRPGVSFTLYQHPGGTP